MNDNQTSIQDERQSSPTDQASKNISNTETNTTEPVQLGAAPLFASGCTNGLCGDGKDIVWRAPEYVKPPVQSMDVIAGIIAVILGVLVGLWLSTAIHLF